MKCKYTYKQVKQQQLTLINNSVNSHALNFCCGRGFNMRIHHSFDAKASESRIPCTNLYSGFHLHWKIPWRESRAQTIIVYYLGMRLPPQNFPTQLKSTVMQLYFGLQVILDFPSLIPQWPHLLGQCNLGMTFQKSKSQLRRELESTVQIMNNVNETINNYDAIASHSDSKP